MYKRQRKREEAGPLKSNKPITLMFTIYDIYTIKHFYLVYFFGYREIKIK